MTPEGPKYQLAGNHEPAIGVESGAYKLSLRLEGSGDPEHRWADTFMTEARVLDMQAEVTTYPTTTGGSIVVTLNPSSDVPIPHQLESLRSLIGSVNEQVTEQLIYESMTMQSLQRGVAEWWAGLQA